MELIARTASTSLSSGDWLDPRCCVKETGFIDLWAMGTTLLNLPSWHGTAEALYIHHPITSANIYTGCEVDYLLQTPHDVLSGVTLHEVVSINLITMTGQSQCILLIWCEYCVIGQIW